MIKLRNNRFPNKAWLRTCQECFNIQEDKEPKQELTSAYRNRKCKNCKSESLDFGTTNEYEEFDDE